MYDVMFIRDLAYFSGLNCTHMRRWFSNKVAFFSNSHYKMMLYSVHDTSVAALLIALGIFDDKWPGFAADLTFELYRDKVTKYHQLTKQILRHNS